jgi:ketosteroid isomerase-like protein
MSDLDDFLTTTLARQIAAEEALHNGDVQPRLAMWSTHDPVTVLGAMRSASGWDEVSHLFRSLASHFSDCTSYRFELATAGVSGDLAYTVGYEHTSVSWDGSAPAPPRSSRTWITPRVLPARCRRICVPPVLGRMILFMQRPATADCRLPADSSPAHAPARAAARGRPAAAAAPGRCRAAATRRSP